MDQNIITTPSIPDINELVRLYSKEKGISETAAWAAIRSAVVPKNEVLNIIEAQSKQNQQPQQPRLMDILQQKEGMSLEKLRVEYELRRQEDEREERKRRREREENEEQRRQEREERENRLKEKQLEIDKDRLAYEKEIAYRKLELEKSRIEAKEDFERNLLLIQTGSERDKQYYERLHDQTQTHYQELGALRDKADERIREIEKDMREGKYSENAFTKIQELRTFEKEIYDLTKDMLEARGIDTSIFKKSFSAHKEDENPIDKLMKLGKTLWKDLEPKVDQANAQAQLQAQQQQILTKEQEEQIRRETTEAAEKNKHLRQELDNEKDKEKKRIESYNEERRKLEYRAAELGLVYESSISNDDLFDMVEQQEADIEKIMASRLRQHTRMADAEMRRQININDAPVTIDDAKPEIIDEVEKTEPESEPEPQTHKFRSLDQKLLEEGDAEEGEPKEISISIQEELAMPREQSPETQEFIKSINTDGSSTERVVEPTDDSEKEVQEPQPQEVQERKTIAKPRTKTGKFRNYTITKQSDGSPIDVISSQRFNGAAMKVAKSLKGTKDKPVRIVVTEDESGTARVYDVYLEETSSKKGKKYMTSRAVVIGGQEQEE